ncbi:MAG: hypothetical protein CVT89_07520 [Candidatus Altiarchaeales archaeon HGW-Altiarchaeales-2]|nr:MAG: hypothetical protein CVT89_07520 [Candidatus Altiarchaeales archaeon HGW-Altiarchaeales-2]
MNLASTGKIKIAIPEYSLAEVDGRVSFILRERKKKLKESITLMNELSRSDYNKKYSSGAIENLNMLLNLLDKEKKFVDEAIKSIRDLCVVIPHTPEIHIKAALRDLSSKPPFKFNDCQIYLAALDFAGKNKNDCNIIFLTKDREDFDYPEIHDELNDNRVKLMFSSGECVKEVVELIG